MLYMNIHIVGAEHWEMLTRRMWEELTHMLPNIKTLMLEFVGPGVCVCVCLVSRITLHGICMPT